MQDSKQNLARTDYQVVGGEKQESSIDRERERSGSF